MYWPASTLETSLRCDVPGTGNQQRCTEYCDGDLRLVHILSSFGSPAAPSGGLQLAKAVLESPESGSAMQCRDSTPERYPLGRSSTSSEGRVVGAVLPELGDRGEGIVAGNLSSEKSVHTIKASQVVSSLLRARNVVELRRLCSSTENGRGRGQLLIVDLCRESLGDPEDD